MFEYVYPTGGSALSFDSQLFSSYNSQLRSMNAFASNSRVSTLPDISPVLGNLMFANYAFARAGVTDANIFGDGSTNSLKQIRGMFYGNESLDGNTDISDITLPSNADITGNFYLTGNTSSGKNIDLTNLSSTSYSGQITTSHRSAFTIGSYIGA